MRVNGYLTYRIPESGSTYFNEDGEPIVQDDTDSDEIKCFVETNTHSERGTYDDGKFTSASYYVLLERRSLPAKIDFIKLWRGGEYLGEFEVQDRQEISLDRIKLTV